MIDTRAIFLPALMLVSCTSLTPVRPDQVHTDLKAGDTVEIVTRDGNTTTFDIVAVIPEAIVGKDRRIALADIAELQKRKVDAGKTVGLIAIIAGFVAMIGLAVLGFAALGGAL
ncbi:MAG: hypothetical protein ACREK6_08555 [Candidatus Rokuibacteriota bacterium]